MAESSVEGCQSLENLSCVGLEKNVRIQTSTMKVEWILTFLSNEVNQGDESDIRRGSHGVVQ